ncbi:molybdopterin-guanine dinucleotide biosynthesis protein [Cryobacterium sp. TMT1-3]|uniref:molybdenum cofactor guanylyltransferase n=1 Tax=Cryobacterium sp. TMT1-3 TaxID=1259237 RepID=UPI001069D455|nr:NTP transferase domain-containing protein [Cryobacterium sp. TMT1-3]TFC24445.1 molybdopterin-guanine dinucleotide biosynthesis protein [Cryobacterium sp. TMT1-3]
MSPHPTTIDLIVLAGGRGSRLGGALKPAVEVAGRTLLSRVLDARPVARHAVVVGSPAARPAAGDHAGAALNWALEDPPFGGPVAGIAAGLTTLAANADEPADWLLVLACDLPWGADAARLLVAAASALDTASLTAPLDPAPPAPALDRPEHDTVPSVDGVHLVDASGHAQWLAAIYRAPALRAAVSRLGDRVNGASMRELLAGLNLDGLPDESETGTDVDTWQDVESSSNRLTHANPTEE